MLLTKIINGDNLRMSNRIRDIFFAIHHPPITGRQVLALSRSDAERLPLLPGVAMISIIAPGSFPAQLPDYEFLLQMSFSDVDVTFLKLTSRAKKKLATGITKEQAVEIHAFVNGLSSEIHTLLVHCEGGFSRSCGVASALYELYGYSVELERLKDANQGVKKLLVEVGQTLQGK